MTGVRMLEEGTGFSIAELAALPIKQLVEILPRDLAGLARSSMVEIYSMTPVRPLLAGELRPRVFDSELNYRVESVMRAPVRVVPSMQHMRHSLLFSHGISIYDPLLIGLDVYARGTVDSWLLLKLSLRAWLEVAPLVETGVIITTNPLAHDTRGIDGHKAVDAATDDPAFLIRLMEIGVWRRSPRARLPVDALIARAKQSEAFAEALRMGFFDEGRPWYRDLGRLLDEGSVPGTDRWFPSQRHFLFFRALIQDGYWTQEPITADALSLSKLMDVFIPSIDEVSAADMRALRSQSDVLADWREELGFVLENWDGGFGESTFDIRTVRDHLRGYAEGVSSRLRKDAPTVFTTASRALAVGAIGAVAGSAVAEWEGIGPALVAGLAGAATSVGIDLHDRGTRQRAVRAAVRHALIVSEARSG
jgi:hypothetical protein